MVHAVAVASQNRISSNSPVARATAAAVLVERARACLRADSHRLENVSCDFHCGALRLRGEVPTYYLKQVAQSLLLSVSGDHRIQNELIVIS
jgi:hypothetical protein